MSTEAVSDSSASDDAPDPTEVPADAADVGRSLVRAASRPRLLLAAVQVGLAIAVIVAVVVSPDGVSALVARLAGIALVVGGVRALLREVGRPATSRPRLVGDASAVLVGAFLVVDPDRWLTSVGRVVGALMVIVGVAMSGSALRSRPVSGALVRRGSFGVVVGLLLAAFNDVIFEQIAIVGMAAAAATTMLRLGIRAGFVELDPGDESRRPVLVRWIDQKSKTPQRREDIYEQVFFEGERAPSRLGRFYLMMLFASVIAAAGVLADSTAVVIGAMLVAPLINPMMGMGLSLATGWPNRLGRSTLVVLGGIAVAVGVGALLAASGIPVDVAANSQILSRSSPRLLDLVIAVAAGAAGAYAMSRKDASSSLPGVAVAIALVPPLSVVGITMQDGDWDQAAGTLLLFLTNLVAIILAGGSVFILTGVVPLHRFAENQRRVRTALGSVAVLALLVVGALVVNGRQIAADGFAQDDAQQVVADWLGGETEFAVVSLDIDAGDVSVVLAGPGDPPNADSLVEALSESLHTDVRLDLQWIPRQRIVVSSN
ncbi:MAG: DUF389 domain-containing protein [Ilumatobacter sp.]|uniref:DUF389 domain-containing protein n=1 Tax=Ilumatobacter sp. TaxID=1967498 RepID=UPI003C76EDC2